MYIYGKKGKLGIKSENIIELYDQKINIPKTWIIQKGEEKFFDIAVLDSTKKYILRPSYSIEDTENKSYAGFFKSIFPLSVNEVGYHLKENFGEIIHQNFRDSYLSMILQEFITSEIYGVYFSRDPRNIMKKGFYEVGRNNDTITGGSESKKLHLRFIQEKELVYIGRKCEKIFKYPVDIEFAIKQGEVVIFQCRPITTGNTTIYSFQDICKITGVFIRLDFDELGEISDRFSYEVISKIFNCVLIGGNIYFKKTLLPKYLWVKNEVKDKNLKLFIFYYQIYLRLKIIYSLLRFFIPQRLDKTVVLELLKDYRYSFLRHEKSHLDIHFNSHTNLITREFIKCEKMKNTAFKHLEAYKKTYEGEDSQVPKGKSVLYDTLIISRGCILNTDKKKSLGYNWIYKGKIEGNLVNLETLKRKKGLLQVLILTNLDAELYDVLDFVCGVIVKNGNRLSHNSIVLREYEIPSIIQYTEFEKLKVGEHIYLFS